MILYPAIDLKAGKCVRLLRGEMGQATIFNDDPAAQARLFIKAGCRFLHVVDLDGAFAGTSVNGPAIERIIAACNSVPVQLGGGIRDLAAIHHWLERGVTRVILGTKALTDPAFVKSACRAHPGRIAIGIDARGGKVAVEGWAKMSHMTALDLALGFEDAGASAIIHTDIERDGALGGVNVEATAALARRLTTPVIASGGVASLEDLKALKAHEAEGVSGVICGRALYDGRLDLVQALALLEA
ncbi:MAG TPA: 1-(5-phosphoribosyl)-5-[(5-phosphoribosylamino)methylideneamino]imidazole-4-carboxamide isomerase [Stellaceae bacterium]|nr:1-(5-phosphoribosyl)-5-[(5-phosphoribosylamino)methylideneamino]imidazole-4-carboxamide isomerase [Stellaceae bacterium]